MKDSLIGSQIDQAANEVHRLIVIAIPVAVRFRGDAVLLSPRDRVLDAHSLTSTQCIDLLLLPRQRMIAPSALLQAHLGGQAHLLHPLKAAVAIEGRPHSLKLVEDAALLVVVFEGLKVVRSTTD